MERTMQSNISNHIRSISLPSKSNPNIVGIEEELNKFKTQGYTNPPTLATIYSNLSQLEGLHKCADDLLNFPLTQQALFHHQSDKCVDELLDGSVKILDICSIIRDFVSHINEHVTDLQSAIRRRKGDSSIGISLLKFTSFRRKMKKEAIRLIVNLKKVDNKMVCLTTSNFDHHVSVVVRILREVSAMSIVIFQSLLLFLSSPVLKSKSSKWSLVSKLIRKGTSTHDEQQIENMNDLEKVDVELYELCEGDNTQFVQKRLEALRVGMESIESRLEGVFRRMIRKRASLLNIISHL